MSKRAMLTQTIILALMFIAIYGPVAKDTYPTEKGSSGLVKKLSNKFQLDEAEITSFMQELKADQFALMYENLSDHLDSAVSAGVISPDQKLAILDMRAMHWAEVDSIIDLTIEERHELNQDNLDRLKIWADKNGVDFSSLRLRTV